MSRGGARKGAGRPHGSTQALRKQLAEKAQPAIDKLVELATGENASTSALKIMLDRIVPPLKPETKTVTFEFEGDSASQWADSILKATATGQLSPSVAVELLNGIASTMKIIEVDELQKRLKTLEEVYAESKK